MIRSATVIAGVADECRAAYIRERQWFQMLMDGDERPYVPSPKWDGKHFPDCYDDKSIWPRIARFMIEKELDPCVCIWARFQYQKSINLRRPVLPTQLALEKYLPMYAEATEEAAESVKHQFEFEKSYLVTEMRMLRRNEPKTRSKEICEIVLLDDTTPVAPLLRYCLASQEGFEKVKDWFYESACAQYRRFPKLYDEYWASAELPKEITEKVRADRALVVESEVHNG